ncbi:hypothetical protein FACS1894130_08020 [Spirochaetia bacterium]|nr:hypothetical protein FACS1894130_08020 [Spirochaetia bacterium]
MNITHLSIPFLDTYNFTGGRLHGGRLVCPAYQATADILNRSRTGSGELTVKVAALEDGAPGAYGIAISDRDIGIKGDTAGVYSAFSVLAGLAREDERGSWFPTGELGGHAGCGTALFPQGRSQAASGCDVPA